jgi:hypothetical protein
MNLIIKEGMLIEDIQKRFSDFYPLLKIEFFRNKHALNTLSPKQEKLPEHTAIALSNRNSHTTSIDISQKVTVGALEKECWNKTGFSVQVFRKYRNLWIETSLTDYWTLEKQSNTAAQYAVSDEKSFRQQMMVDRRYDME